MESARSFVRRWVLLCSPRLTSVCRQSPLPHSQYSLMSAPHVGPVTCVRWSLTGDYALSGGQDRGIHLWNPSKTKHIKAYTGAHGREVKDVQM